MDNFNKKSVLILMSVLCILSLGVGCGKRSEKNAVNRANEFVKDLNDSDGDDNRYALAKATSLQEGYIVILDNNTHGRPYFSVDIRNWGCCGGAERYLDGAAKQGRFYGNLQSNHNGTYTYYNLDGSQGPTFSLRSGTEMDMRKVAAHMQETQKKRIAATLRADYSFTKKAALSMAEATLVYQQTGLRRERTTEDVSHWVQAGTGSSLQEIITAVEAEQYGNVGPINAVLARANKAGFGTDISATRQLVVRILEKY